MSVTLSLLVSPSTVPAARLVGSGSGTTDGELSHVNAEPEVLEPGSVVCTESSGLESGAERGEEHESRIYSLDSRQKNFVCVGSV